MLQDPESKPDAAYIGVAANVHGSAYDSAACMEVQLHAVNTIHS